MHQETAALGLVRDRGSTSAPAATPAPRERPTRTAYLPGLDGLRALAVVAVLAYHFDVPHALGGFLGVDLFFVISGYLISSQLWARWTVRGVDLRAFWLGRIRRLFPAVLALVAITALAMLVAGRDQLGVFVGDVGAAATYTSNWWYILHERSYFEATGRPPVLQHLWSLAVEEQFYLVWPLLLAGVLRWVPRWRVRRQTLLFGSLGLAVASAVVMGLGTALTRTPELGDPSRWYFGTDSHATGLLLGAALAFRRGGAGFGPLMPPLRAATVRATLVGTVALAGLLAALGWVDQYMTALYRVGFAWVAVLGVLLVAVVSRPGPLQRVFSGRLVRYVGRRSYGLYLWHWPVAAFTRPDLDLPWSGLRVFLLRVTLTVVLAELSFRLVEEPVRRQGWRHPWACQRWTPTVVRLAAVQLVIGLSLTFVVPPRADPIGALADPAAAAPSKPGPAPGPGAAATPGTPAKAVPSLTPDRVTARSDLSVTIYGDSVALGAQPALQRWFGRVDNRAQLAEHSWTMLPDIAADARAGRVGSDVVVIHTGDNGLVPEDELRAALDALAGAREVILVTPKVPRSWETRAIHTIEAVVPDYRNVQLADWHSYAQNHPDWFEKDGIHLRDGGQEAYARLIVSRITLPAKPGT